MSNLWQIEFPRMTDMPEIPAGFIDSSWHNDAMPLFTKGEHHSPDCLSIWVDFPNKADSDIGDAHDWHRFSLVQGAYGEILEQTILCVSDDWQDILRAIAKVEAEEALDNFNYVGSRHHY